MQTVNDDAAPDNHADALVAALLELERHVGQEGWDQPPRLFALVSTDALVDAEPDLAGRLGILGTADGGHPHALTAIEQDHFRPSSDLAGDLASIVWPDTVHGCALSMESNFLPADAEADVPVDAEAATAYVADHEQHQQMRVVVGAVRGDRQHGVARIRSRQDELLGAPDLVPGLADALAHTLAAPEEMSGQGQIDRDGVLDEEK
jgi:hypothetical protein